VTIRPIEKFPSVNLRKTAEPISTFGDETRILAADLLDTLRAASGLAITAPHIGVLKRLVVMELSKDNGIRVYINPKIVWASPEMILHPEGSVSMPGVIERIERHAQVRVSYQDLDGAEQIEEADELLAVCHQHEIDQLDGIFWIQKVSRLKRDRLIKQYEKILRSDPARSSPIA
jgi:peptide deformylase